MSRWLRTGGFVLALGLSALAGWGDYLTGDAVVFTLFYIVPVAVATLLAGRAAGTAVAALCAGIAWVVGPHGRNLYAVSWNTFSELTLYLVLVWLLSDLKRRAELEAERALTDPLTGLLNRRGFREAALRELERSRRYGQPITLAFLDVDDFKIVNDRFGHQIGDQVLETLAGIFRRRLRVVDVGARLGGDEFALLMPSTAEAEAKALLRDLVAQVAAEARARDWPVGLSIGVATFAPAPSDLELVLRQADALMYEVKRVGKGQILHRTFGAAR
jgi:diguanylate cyclase (GGDEF)-like protein